MAFEYGRSQVSMLSSAVACGISWQILERSLLPQVSLACELFQRLRKESAYADMHSCTHATTKSSTVKQ